ncbi:RDD family protein [Chishuiella sp.]|uniref:RDD family protein n=1 Tax=Chishuiella sp. TaxID=1969467 RepID=UPI0028ADF490|nr:RDD family protein [Chishuiella sp.]
MHQDYTVGENKANQGVRFLNFIIDSIFIVISIIIIFSIISLFIYFINPESNIFNEIENIHPLLDRILTSSAYFLIYFGIEAITKGRSIGKYITGTKVVMIDGTNPTIKDYFSRNISRIIPFDAFSFLGGNGWHDKISKTTVVNKKAFEESLKTNSTIDEIGQ